jgi:hypothetical protein
MLSCLEPSATLIAIPCRVSIGPSYSTKRMESAASLFEFLKAYPPAAPLIGDLVAKNMDFPGAEEMAKRLKNTIPPQVLADPDDPESMPPPPPNPLDDPTVRVELDLKHAQARKAMADARKVEMETVAMFQQPMLTPEPPLQAPEQPAAPPAPPQQMMPPEGIPPDMMPDMGPPAEMMPGDDEMGNAFPLPPQGESDQGFIQ